MSIDWLKFPHVACIFALVLLVDISTASKNYPENVSIEQLANMADRTECDFDFEFRVNEKNLYIAGNYRQKEKTTLSVLGSTYCTYHIISGDVVASEKIKPILDDPAFRDIKVDPLRLSFILMSLKSKYLAKVISRRINGKQERLFADLPPLFEGMKLRLVTSKSTCGEIIQYVRIEDKVGLLVAKAHSFESIKSIQKDRMWIKFSIDISNTNAGLTVLLEQPLK
jgi:hypothetical protein